MENIYKIKIRSNPNPRDLYPSERRYSSSIVLGLSIMFLALGITSSLMATLVVRRMTNNETVPSNATEDQRLMLRVEQDLLNVPQDSLNFPVIVSAGTLLMSFGLFLAGISGLFAWKQWYIDHNITWFCFSSFFSTFTSSISIITISLSVMETKETIFLPVHPISLGLRANIFITSLLSVAWSIIAANVAFKGMKNDYPDDIVLSKSGKGRIEVYTVRKGNKIAKVVPPDILNDFPKSGKLAKYLAKSETHQGLPKAESNKEYEERVKKFLDGETESYKN